MSTSALEGRAGSSSSPTVFFLRIKRLAEGETALISHLPSMECQVTCNRAVNIDYFLL